MNSKVSFLVLSLLILSSGLCMGQEKITSGHKKKLEQLKKEVSEELTKNLLPYWSSRMVDNVNGGFYGRIDGNNKVYPEAEKGGILNARILWTYSSAYRITGDTSYLRLAIRAKEYILANFIDKQYGGAYFSLKADGTPSNTRKQVYTNAFFIYGLAEYSRATGDKGALSEAMKIFDALEKYASDKEYGGYYEVFSQEWQRLRERMIGESSEKDEKTMNTSLHLMEAYANLYRVSRDNIVSYKLKDLVELFLDKIIDKKSSHLICFMDRQWNPTSTVDSYGHDIESSWLLLEAANLLKDKKLTERVKAAGLKIANAAAEGIQPDGGMLTEKNYATGEVRIRRSWWEQAETIVGYLNAFELTGDESYLDNSLKCWEYTKKYFIDKKNGGWFSNVSETGVPGGDKGGFWICPYHNGRMCMEVIERVNAEIQNRAQNRSETISTHYVLPEFEKGIVKMKDGHIEEANVNYNMISEEMIFEKEGTRLAMDKIENINTVYLGSLRFVPYEKYFLEILLEDQVSLFVRHKLNVLKAGSPSGYGGTTETGVAYSISHLTGSGNLYKLQLPSEYHLTDASQFWIKKGSSFSRISTERQILDVFPENSKDLKQFIRQNKINLRKEKDVTTLIKKCNELIM